MPRYFAVAKGWEDKNITLPKRQTKHAAGYDLCAAEDVVVPPYSSNIDQKPTLIPTGLKATMHNDDMMLIVSRGSTPAKHGLVIPNSMAVIDADYFENPTNDGHFYIQVLNIRSKPYTIKKGDTIAQAIFVKYLITDDDDADGERQGGFGSTDKKPQSN